MCVYAGYVRVWDKQEKRDAADDERDPVHKMDRDHLRHIIVVGPHCSGERGVIDLVLVRRRVDPEPQRNAVLRTPESPQSTKNALQHQQLLSFSACAFAQQQTINPER